jgi:hypothetical protein
MVVAPVGLLDAVVLDHSGRVSSTSAIVIPWLFLLWK